MQDAVMSLVAMCMVAALCTQLLGSKTYRFSLRLVLGLEVFRVLLELADGFIPMLN